MTGDPTVRQCWLGLNMHHAPHGAGGAEAGSGDERYNKAQGTFGGPCTLIREILPYSPKLSKHVLWINLMLVSESSSLMFVWPDYSQREKHVMWAQGPPHQLCFSPDQFAHLFALQDLLKSPLLIIQPSTCRKSFPKQQTFFWSEYQRGA